MHNAFEKLKREIVWATSTEQKKGKHPPGLVVTPSSSQLLGSDSDDNVQVVYGAPGALQVLPLRGLGEARVTRVACGTSHILLLLHSGALYALEGSACAVVPLPGPCAAVACGPAASAAVLAGSGSAFVWGKVSRGSETFFASPSPVPVGAPESLGSVAGGSLSFLFCSQSGKRVFAWGSNYEYSLGLDEKTSLVAKQCEPVVFEGIPDEAIFTQVVAQGSYALALTDKGALYGWGGSKKECRPALLSDVGLPGNGFCDVAFVTANGATPMVVTKPDGVVFWKKGAKKGEWIKWENAAVAAASSRLVAVDDMVYCVERRSGKLCRYNAKQNEAVMVQSIRVAEFAVSSTALVLVLAVPNRRTRIFGTLHPEPLLKLATPKGMIEWIVKTGCRYQSDLGAFLFAFPVILKMLSKEHRVENNRGSRGLESFVKMLKRLYQKEEDDTSRGGVNKLLQAWIDARPPATDARAVLQLTQSFLTEGEQASLWKAENLRALPTTTLRRISVGNLNDRASQQQGALEMEDVQALNAKTAAATLTLMRSAQFSSLASVDIVKFCTLTPDPVAFEQYPRVAEYVDFGNTLGRWAKHFVLTGGSKQGRGERLKWLFAVVQDLEVLRNYDLCFHLSSFATWELMPDIAKQSKVDIDGMLEVVRRYGDRKFWNGQYQDAMKEALQIKAVPSTLATATETNKPCIPLLVYHSNLISGGFGGSESIIEKPWDGQSVSYINVSKFRSIGEQQQLLQGVAALDQVYASQLKSVASRDSDIFHYFSRASAPSDAELTVLRSEIIPVSRHRESGKTTSFEQFAGEVVAAISAKEHRVVKWLALVAQLESDEETIRMRSTAPFLVCPRDAVLEGGLLGGIVRSLLQTTADVEWASSEYWLLRRILASLVPKANLEDIIMSCATLYERSYDSLPDVAEELSVAFVDFVVRNGDSDAVIKAARNLSKASIKLVPELDGKIATFEENMRAIKTQGGKLTRAQILSNIGGEMTLNAASNKGRVNNNATMRMKEKHDGMEESLKLVKAKLEHFGAQRSLMVACQGASRDFAVLLDLWRTSASFTVSHGSRSNLHEYAHFVVTHLGSKWQQGENLSFIHREPQGMRLKEFQEKLAVMYATLDVVILETMGGKVQPVLKANVVYLNVAAVRIDEEADIGANSLSGSNSSIASVTATPAGDVPARFTHEVPFTREGSMEPWKKRMRYATEPAGTKKRLLIVDTKTDLLSPIESSIEEIQSRTAVVRSECLKKSPDSSTALILQSAISTSNTGILKACAHLVDKQKAEDVVSKLSLAMWDFLLAIREGLAFFSCSPLEDDMRVHHLLCKSFRELLSLVLPSLGPPAQENFHFASLYSFVSMLLPAGFAKPLVDSPMVQRRNSRVMDASAATPTRGSRAGSATSPRSVHRNAAKKAALESTVVAAENLDGLPKSPFFDKKKK